MSSPSGILEFGPFRLDGARRLLWRAEELMPVTPKALEVLQALVERQGQVVDKRELLERVWPDTFVEEANLSVNVSALRKALGVQDGGRPYIETVARRGYRFVGRARSAQEALRSLAVLPFRLPEGAPAEEGLGLADALITRLGRLGQIVVRPTGLVARYADAEPDVQEVARALQVDAVLIGRLQRTPERVRATLQLIGAKEGATLWADTLDAAPSHIFDVQDAISERVARALTLRLSAADRERLTRRHTASVAAYEAYLRGRWFWNKLTGPWLLKARAAYEEALAEDPGYALAHVGLAETCIMLGVYGLLKPGEAWPQALAAAERALAADELLGEAHIARAWGLLFRDWDFAGAERAIARALELEPASAGVRQWYALYLGMVGRFEDALAEVRRAQELDPLSLAIGANTGFQFYLAHQLGADLAELKRTLELEPEFAVGHWALALAYESRGEYDAAIAENARAVALSADSPLMQTNLARAHALAGHHEQARALLAELQAAAVSPYRLATVQLALGDREAALACLERGCRERDHWMVWLKVDPMLEALRGDPRFAALVARVGFPPQAPVGPTDRRRA